MYRTSIIISTGGVWTRWKRNYFKAIDFEDRNASVKAKILANTVISRNHLTPEIKLRLITHECALYHAPHVHNNAENVFENDPFWAFYWPGGQALTRYILDNPLIVANKSILDVGSGSGACSIASKIRNSKIAVANDIDYDAAIAAQINSQLNRTAIETCCDNLIGTTCEEFNVILVGDVFYDKDIADEILPWLKVLRSKGKDILVGDPGRHGLTAEATTSMVMVATYELPENCCIENNGFKYANVWRFK